MKTILVTGGANGIGKGIATHYLKNGYRVIAVGNSKANGDVFLNEAKQSGAEERAIFILADLSLISENQKVIEDVKSRFDSLDALIFCAAKHSKAYTETTEGLELTFALAYMSRFILNYGLKECLEKSSNPVIFNICGSGMKGEVNWSDLGHKNSFEPQKVMMHGSRLNDLLGVEFARKDKIGKIKYILYNPMAVRTPGMMETFNSPLMHIIYKLIGKSVEKATILIAELLDNPPASMLSAYRERKKLNLTMASYDKKNAVKLYNITTELLKKF